MKSLIFKTSLAIILISIGLGACVSSKKYKDLSSKYDQAKRAEQGSTNELMNLQRENDFLRQETQNLQLMNSQLKTDLDKQKESQSYEKAIAEEKNRRLQAAYEQLAQNKGVEIKSNNQPKSTYNRQNPTLQSPNTNFNNRNNTSNEVNKNYQGLTNDLVNSVQPTSSTNVAQATAELKDLQTQLTYVLQNLSEQDVQVQNTQNQVIIGLNDEKLFDNNLNLTTWGKEVLQQSTNLLKTKPDLQIMLASEIGDTEHENASIQKAQKIADFLKNLGINATFSPKNYSPLAFDTSGTQVKQTQSYLILKPR